MATHGATGAASGTPEQRGRVLWSSVKKTVEEEGAQALATRRGDVLRDVLKRTALLTTAMLLYLVVGGAVYEALERPGEVAEHLLFSGLEETVGEVASNEAVGCPSEALEEMLVAGNPDPTVRSQRQREQAEAVASGQLSAEDIVAPAPRPPPRVSAPAAADGAAVAAGVHVEGGAPLRLLPDAEVLGGFDSYRRLLVAPAAGSAAAGDVLSVHWTDVGAADGEGGGVAVADVQAAVSVTVNATGSFLVEAAAEGASAVAHEHLLFVLRRVAFSTTSDAPVPGERAFWVSVTSTTGRSGAPLLVTADVAPTNDAPGVSGPSTAVLWQTGGSEVGVGADINIDDPDGAQEVVQRAQVVIAAGANEGDVLAFSDDAGDDALALAVPAAWDSDTFTLSLGGVDGVEGSASQWTAVLARVVFDSTARQTIAPIKQIAFSVQDAGGDDSAAFVREVQPIATLEVWYDAVQSGSTDVSIATALAATLVIVQDATMDAACGMAAGGAVAVVDEPFATLDDVADGTRISVAACMGPAVDSVVAETTVGLRSDTDFTDIVTLDFRIFVAFGADDFTAAHELALRQAVAAVLPGVSAADVVIVGVADAARRRLSARRFTRGLQESAAVIVTAKVLLEGDEGVDGDALNDAVDGAAVDGTLSDALSVAGLPNDGAAVEDRCPGAFEVFDGSCGACDATCGTCDAAGEGACTSCSSERWFDADAGTCNAYTAPVVASVAAENAYVREGVDAHVIVPFAAATVSPGAGGRPVSRLVVTLTGSSDSSGLTFVDTDDVAAAAGSTGTSLTLLATGDGEGDGEGVSAGASAWTDALRAVQLEVDDFSSSTPLVVSVVATDAGDADSSGALRTVDVYSGFACPAGWVQSSEGACFAVDTSPVSHDSAAAECVGLHPGATPASIHSAQQLADAVAAMGSSSTAWLGTDSNPPFLWLDGSASDDGATGANVWKSGEPASVANGNMCVTLSGSGGVGLRTHDCDEAEHVVCWKPACADVPDDRDTDTTCYLSVAVNSWHEAEAACAATAEHTEVVQVTTFDQKNLIYAQVCATGTCFVQRTRAATWADGTAWDFDDWGAGLDATTRWAGACVMLQVTDAGEDVGHFAHSGCGNLKGTVCSIVGDMSVADTAATTVSVGATSLTITGSGFTEPARVWLTSSGGAIAETPTAVSVDSSSQITVSVDALPAELAGETILAVVATDGGHSGAAVAVATVDAARRRLSPAMRARAARHRARVAAMDGRRQLSDADPTDTAAVTLPALKNWDFSGSMFFSFT